MGSVCLCRQQAILFLHIELVLSRRNIRGDFLPAKYFPKIKRKFLGIAIKEKRGGGNGFGTGVGGGNPAVS